MKSNKLVLALVMTIITYHYVNSQNVQKKPEFYNWFDNQINKYNTSLFNGLEYIELYRTINERHKFFKSSEFLTGSINYDGQFYDKVPLKYDLDADELLFNVGYNYPYPTLILFKSKTQSFSLGGSEFIQINNTVGEAQMTGFYELLMESRSIILLKKNNKRRFKRIKGRTVYYEFDYENSYFIKYEGDFHKINSKSDIIRIWPDKKEYINEHFNPALRKINEDNFWTSFFSKLADTFNTKKEGEQL
ncbi:hypothetical protein [Maribacter sp. ACAM166]|uniref:hypothetical protein n=1 Tax=Maribacter sp. ACAM166 TaxID=2508996 RepID=UPI0010FE7CA6|nr:hypothetical protein [Maribacter sp. ACAM166]TLP79804.1 hypothetical protein ES765_10020 [Maribacter sp. ACAM166]